MADFNPSVRGKKTPLWRCPLETPVLRAIRGTVDILPEEQPYWRLVEQRAVELCERFGYGRIDTPVFEASGLFHRSVGATSDIVEKETYTFNDRGGDSITLRPEGTAPVCRAYLEHGMHVLPQPVRLYSARMPMFRYDRPQAGRYREFHQINAEVIGEADASVDAEIIELAWRLFESLGLTGLALVLNSIGDAACRPGYLEALRQYYAPHQDRLCPDCRRRYHTNVLRLLDCKNEGCQPFVANAPRGIDHLCAECRTHWDQLTGYLTALGLRFTVEHRLVRGLDYYTRTVFEIQPPIEGAQSVLGGGGRYDGLIQELGGKPTPGVGFACGMERVILNLKRQGVQPPAPGKPAAIVAFIGEVARPTAAKLASDLRLRGLPVLMAPGDKSLKGQMRYVTAMGAPNALILGEDEVRQGLVTIKDMATGSQRQVPMSAVADALLAPQV